MRFFIAFALLCGALAAQPQDPWNYRGRPNWDRSWNNRPFPREGACFFKDAGFRGDRFCVTRGDRLESLPGNFGDNISSMQVFGRSRVTVFNDRNFRGGREEFRASIQDLREARFRDGHTWNNRISSIIVR
ncbi:MAG TPA: peptidase inhibitor family I36 protein [Bryobacteraceae bacterium]|nr:peptidase inhibitor family I36 protein [Bryobacteraceae bacterium]